MDDATPEPRDSSAGLRKKIYCTGPIITFYMKQQTAQQVTAAAASGDPKTQSEQGCEAAFYLGEDALLRRQEGDALRLLKQARETCPPSFIEYDAAGFELQRLDK